MRKSAKIIWIIALSMIAIGGAFLAWHMTHAVRTISEVDSSGTPVATPTFQTILPSGKSISSLGGWHRVSPPGNDPVFAYTDKLAGVPIIVSEQQIPKSFDGKVSQKVADVAKSYSADDKLTVDGTIVYVGYSLKGPQSVIFTKKNLLILIRSDALISNTAWGTYVASLT